MSKYLLLSLSLSVFYFIFYYADINGLRAMGDAAVAAKKIPGTNYPLRTEYTGLPLTDKLLTTLTVFFWPTVDGSHPALFIHSLAFSGTFAAAWVLVTLETWRVGNAWSLAGFSILLGLAAQVLTFAFAAPMYGFLHLLAAATADKPTAENMRIPYAVLKVLPHVFFVGNALPSLLMALPLGMPIPYGQYICSDLKQMTPDLKQILIAVWQPWPAYTAILLTVANFVLGSFVTADKSFEGKRKTNGAIRYIYAFAFGTTAIAHVVAVTIPIATLVAPKLFVTKLAAAMHPLKVLETPLPWTSPVATIESVGQGVHAFLRWDYIIGTTGVLAWAFILHRKAHRHVERSKNADLCGLVVRTASLTAVAGPVAAAVELMWEREELILATNPAVPPVSKKN